ncbi:MAG: glycosyltransferase [Deltaproteobacteria bacterium]|nr:glycosyltransferase [Deltaproteobacteria bacterium]
MKNETFEPAFLASKRPHILMITNHGIHDWDIRSGLIDTGGQNHYVNALSDTLVTLGFRVTTLNRGGFPDPQTQEMRRGSRYKNEHSRIVYLQGGGASFIRKEDLTREVLQEEGDDAYRELSREGNPHFALTISHYWDGAILGEMLRKKFNDQGKHVWIPHSLGALKKENFKDKPQEVVAPLKFDERIAFEHEVATRVDAIGSTSGDISRTLETSYGRKAELFLPPCINTAAIHPLEPSKATSIYDFLSTQDSETGHLVRGKKCILEVSRTDHTKRKDVLIKAFAKAFKNNPQVMLLLTVSSDNQKVYQELTQLIEHNGIRRQIVFIGSVPRSIMSELYAITTVYCSPSEMEGFGMSVQEACAAGRATVSSDKIPFATEYLLANEHHQDLTTTSGTCTLRWGKGGIVVPAGNDEGFAYALKTLVEDETLRGNMGNDAYHLTIPKFTWPDVTKQMLHELKINLPVSHS